MESGSPSNLVTVGSDWAQVKKGSSLKKVDTNNGPKQVKPVRPNKALADPIVAIQKIIQATGPAIQCISPEVVIEETQKPSKKKEIGVSTRVKSKEIYDSRRGKQKRSCE